ncbi:MAG: hypothetical protein WKF84_06750 [Pyrinomonadaceae bacterium]
MSFAGFSRDSFKPSFLGKDLPLAFIMDSRRSLTSEWLTYPGVTIHPVPVGRGVTQKLFGEMIVLSVTAGASLKAWPATPVFS